MLLCTYVTHSRNVFAQVSNSVGSALPFAWGRQVRDKKKQKEKKRPCSSRDVVPLRASVDYRTAVLVGEAAPRQPLAMPRTASGTAGVGASLRNPSISAWALAGVGPSAGVVTGVSLPLSLGDVCGLADTEPCLTSHTAIPSRHQVVNFFLPLHPSAIPRLATSFHRENVRARLTRARANRFDIERAMIPRP